jgi:hypothetical protein
MLAPPFGSVRTGLFVDNFAGWKAKPGSSAIVGKFLDIADKAPILAEKFGQ